MSRVVAALSGLIFLFSNGQEISSPSANAETILEEGLERRANLGFSVSEESDGFVATRLADGSAAKGAGLRAGDLIISVNGETFTDLASLQLALKMIRGNSAVKLSIRRDDDDLEISFSPPPTNFENIPGITSIYGSMDTKFGTKVRTIITRPNEFESRLPAILFVQWLSCDSIELPFNVDDGWQRMIRLLVARSDMVMMRTEKTGIGDSEGPACSGLDYETELSHHKKALEKLKSLDYVDPDNIIVYGASMGGNMAALLGAGEDVSGVIIWGTALKTWLEHLVEFNRRFLEFSGTPGDQIASKVTKQSEFLDQYLIYGKTPSEIRAEFPGLADAEILGLGNSSHYGRPFAFHWQAQERDWLGAIAKIDVPLLLLFGEYDWFEQLDDHQTAVRMNNRTFPDNAELSVISNMNHHFEIFGSAQDAFDGNNGIYAPEVVINKILVWLRQFQEN